MDSGRVVDPQPGADGRRGTWLTWDQAVRYLRRAPIGERVWSGNAGNGNQFRYVRVPACRIGMRYLSQVVYSDAHRWSAGSPESSARLDRFFQGGPLYKLWSSKGSSASSAATDGRIVDPAQADN